MIDMSLEERQVSKQMHSLKKRISIRILHWLAQGLRKGGTRCHHVNTEFWKKPLFNFAYNREKKSDTCSLFPPATYERDEKSLTLAAYFLCLGSPSLPACYPIKLNHECYSPLTDNDPPRYFDIYTQNFHQYFHASIWNEWNYIVVWTFFAMLWSWSENWPFSPVATAEFSKSAGILNAVLLQYHHLGFEITHLEFHHLH